LCFNAINILSIIIIFVIITGTILAVIVSALSIIVIFVIITGTALAVIISALFISLVLHFSIITSVADICYTREVKNNNIKVNIYTV
jgi:hypothetical protein